MSRGAYAGLRNVIPDPVGMMGWTSAPQTTEPGSPVPFVVPVGAYDYHLASPSAWAPSRVGPQAWTIEGFALAPAGVTGALTFRLRWGIAYNNASPNGYSSSGTAQLSPDQFRAFAPFRVVVTGSIPLTDTPNVTPNLGGTGWLVGGVQMHAAL
jgi:hypothetical protein